MLKLFKFFFGGIFSFLWVMALLILIAVIVGYLGIFKTLVVGLLLLILFK